MMERGMFVYKLRLVVGMILVIRRGFDQDLKKKKIGDENSLGW